MMYMPNQALYEKHKSRSNKDFKRNRLLILCALMIIAGTVTWSIWQSQHADNLGRETEQLMHDAEKLWNWTDSKLLNGASAAEWSIRWDAFVEPGQAQILAERLFVDASGIPTEKQATGGTISGGLPEYGGKLVIHTIGKRGMQEQILLIYTSEPDALLEKEALLGISKLVSVELDEVSEHFTSSLKLYGRTAKPNFAQAFIKQSQSEVIDTYEDSGTSSITLYTALLQHRLQTGEGMRVNMQLATHQMDNHAEQSVTIGTPLITGDYTSTGKSEE